MSYVLPALAVCSRCNKRVPDAGRRNCEHCLGTQRARRHGLQGEFDDWKAAGKTWQRAHRKPAKVVVYACTPQALVREVEMIERYAR